MDPYIKCDNVFEIAWQNILQKVEAKDLKVHLRNKSINGVFARDIPWTQHSLPKIQGEYEQSVYFISHALMKLTV